MIEEELLNYGVLGLWTISLLTERFLFNKNLGKLILANNKILSKVNMKLEVKKNGR